MTTLLLFHFQNCAPANPGQAASGGGQVQLIDDFNKAQLQFVSPETDVQDDVPSADISGLCTRDHEGASLRWAIWAGTPDSTPLFSGTSVCHAGQFNLDVQQLDQMVCGVQHLVMVEGDWGGSTTAHVSRRCQPLASQDIAAPEDSPAGTTCALEYTPDADAAATCMQVCYRDRKVVYSQSADSRQCAGLAAGLAGR